MNKKSKSEEKSSQMGLSLVALQNEANNSACSITYPVWQFRPGMIVEFSQSEWQSETQKEKLEENLKLAQETYTGDITTSGVKRMRKLLEVWQLGIERNNSKQKHLGTSNYKKLVFLTLTLSSTQFHEDNIIKSLILKPFIRILRENYGCSNYIWKAETQNNGNIHFHLAIDCFINKSVVQHVWNKCQEKLGYITEFERKYAHRNPNSTRIEVVRNQKDVGIYLSKYLSKSEGKRRIKGAVWKASKALCSLTYFSVERDTTCQVKLNKMLKNEKVEIKHLDHCNCLYINNLRPISVLSPVALVFYKHYLEILVNHLFIEEEGGDFAAKILENNKKISRIHASDQYRNKEKYVVKHKQLIKQLKLFENENLTTVKKFKD